MISAVNGLPIESHPLIVGRLCAQISFSLFLITGASLKHDLGQLGVEIVGNTFYAALPTHPRIFGAAEGCLRRQLEAVDADHAVDEQAEILIHAHATSLVFTGRPSRMDLPA